MQAPLNDLYAASVDAMKRLAESNWRSWARFTEKHITLLKVCADCGQRQFALWNGNGVQKPADFFAAQADSVRQLSAHLAEYSKVVATGTRDAANEVVRCIEGLSESLDRSRDDDGGDTEALKSVRTKRSGA